MKLVILPVPVVVYRQRYDSWPISRDLPVCRAEFTLVEYEGVLYALSQVSRSPIKIGNPYPFTSLSLSQTGIPRQYKNHRIAKKFDRDAPPRPRVDARALLIGARLPLSTSTSFVYLRPHHHLLMPHENCPRKSFFIPRTPFIPTPRCAQKLR